MGIVIVLLVLSLLTYTLVLIKYTLRDSTHDPQRRVSIAANLKARFSLMFKRRGSQNEDLPDPPGMGDLIELSNMSVSVGAEINNESNMQSYTARASRRPEHSSPGRQPSHRDENDTEWQPPPDVADSESSHSSNGLQEVPMRDKEVDDLEPTPGLAPGLSQPEAGVSLHRKRQFSVEVDENGDQYFVDNLTQETTWDLPANGEVVEIEKEVADLEPAPGLPQ